MSDKVSLSGAANLDFYSIKGNVDIDIKFRGPPVNYSGYYEQWRSASYSGKATGFSGGVDLKYKLGKNISVGGDVGYRNAKVQTSGKEISRTNYSIYTIEKDCSPKLNLENIYFGGKIELKVK